MSELEPGTARLRARGASHGGLPAGRRKRVDPRAEDGDECGEEEKGTGGRQQRDEHASKSHRVQEPLGKRKERGHRGGHGERTECDRSPCCRQHAPERFRAWADALDLLPIAPDDEKAVVERQPDPQARNEIDRVDGERNDQVDEAKREECPQNRSESCDEGQERRYKAAEEEQ